MKTVTYFQQKGQFARTETCGEELFLENSHCIRDGMFLQVRPYSSWNHVHLDLDQVEDLYRRLGEHLREHGRPATPGAPKWKEG